MEQARYCILDMKRVNDIGISGVNVLVRIKAMLERNGKHLFIACLDTNPPLADFIARSGGLETLGPGCLYHDTDSALERAEEHLLTDGFRFSNLNAPFCLEQTSLVRDLTPEEISVLKEKLVRKVFQKDEALFLEGDASRDLYILLRGSVSIRISVNGGSFSARLVTFTPGVCFGEVALLDGSPRSAGAWANRWSELFLLSQEAFQGLCREYPGIAIKILQNISLETGRNLRRLTQDLRVLEAG
jgi:CRP-like cAMP-binding protein